MGALTAPTTRSLVNWSPSEIELPTSKRTALGPPPEDPVFLISLAIEHWPRQYRPVLRDIDLEVAPGRPVCLTGENGANTATLLRILAVIAPDSGRVGVCRLKSRGSRRAHHRHIGLLTAGNSATYAHAPCG
jgi:ABC-type molybdenum transport system ATPase subunit/photorepair protein PhrA